MKDTSPKLLTPCGGSNFLPYSAVEAPDGVAIRPKPYPLRTAVGLTTVLGLFGTGMLLLAHRAGAPVVLMSIPVLLGTFGPALAFWFQAQHAQKQGLVLNFSTARREVELPRIRLRLPKEQVQCLWLVSNKVRELTQLQIQTTTGKAYPLIATLDTKALADIASVVATALAVPIKTCDNAPEVEGNT